MPADVSIQNSENPSDEPRFDILVGGLTMMRVSGNGVSMPHPNVTVGPDLLWLLPFAKTLSERIAIGACRTASQARLLLSSRPAGQKIMESWE